MGALHWPDVRCIQFYFNPHSSNFKLVTSYHPCRLLHPHRGDEAAGESHLIKIKTQKTWKNTPKQASRLQLEELDSPTIAGSIHITLNKEQTATRRWAKRLGGRCLSLTLCWLLPAPCQRGAAAFDPRFPGAGRELGTHAAALNRRLHPRVPRPCHGWLLSQVSLSGIYCLFSITRQRNCHTDVGIVTHSVSPWGSPPLCPHTMGRHSGKGMAGLRR